MNITQIVCLHLPPTPERLHEFYVALHNNINNKLINKIHLFIEDESLIDCDWPEAEQIRELWTFPKIELVKVFKRQMYADLFRYSNEYLEGVIMISNSDIHYDDTLSLLEKVDFSKNAVCLSRHTKSQNGILPIEINDNYREDSIAYKKTSHDTWIFKVPIKDMENPYFYMGFSMCDCRIAYEFNKIGLTPVNPCEDIFSYHIHNSGIRTYDMNIHKCIGNIHHIQPPYHILPKAQSENIPPPQPPPQPPPHVRPIIKPQPRKYKTQICANNKIKTIRGVVVYKGTHK